MNFIEHWIHRSWTFEFSSNEVQSQFYYHPRKINIAAHTMPYLDGLLIYIAMKHWKQTNAVIYGKGSICGYGMKWYKPIPSTGGFIQDEIDDLSYQSSFCSALFPSGGKIKWKSGFYIMAKKLEVPIFIIGLDYSKKTVVIDSMIIPCNTFQETKHICIHRLRAYVPSPFCFFLRVCLNYGDEVFLFDWKWIWFYRVFFFAGLFSFFILFSF
jgi:hypothetical protein